MKTIRTALTSSKMGFHTIDTDRRIGTHVFHPLGNDVALFFLTSEFVAPTSSQNVSSTLSSPAT